MSADSPTSGPPAPSTGTSSKDSFSTTSVFDLDRHYKTLSADLERHCKNTHAVGNDQEEDSPYDASSECSGSSDHSRDPPPPIEDGSRAAYTISRSQSESGYGTPRELLSPSIKHSSLEFFPSTINDYNKDDAASDVDSDGRKSEERPQAELGEETTQQSPNSYIKDSDSEFSSDSSDDYHKENVMSEGDGRKSPRPESYFAAGTPRELPTTPDTGAWNGFPLAGLTQELKLLGSAPYDRDGVFQWLNEPVYLALDEDFRGSFKPIGLQTRMKVQNIDDEEIVWVIEREGGIRRGDHYRDYSEGHSRNRVDGAAAMIEVAGPVSKKGYRMSILVTTRLKITQWVQTWQDSLTAPATVNLNPTVSAEKNFPSSRQNNSGSVGNAPAGIPLRAHLQPPREYQSEIDFWEIAKDQVLQDLGTPKDTRRVLEQQIIDSNALNVIQAAQTARENYQLCSRERVPYQQSINKIIISARKFSAVVTSLTALDVTNHATMVLGGVKFFLNAASDNIQLHDFVLESMSTVTQLVADNLDLVVKLYFISQPPEIQHTNSMLTLRRKVIDMNSGILHFLEFTKYYYEKGSWGRLDMSLEGVENSKIRLL